jgi:hypothetical protein
MYSSLYQQNQNQNQLWSVTEFPTSSLLRIQYQHCCTRFTIILLDISLNLVCHSFGASELPYHLWIGVYIEGIP